jgi:hypothetical protein
MRLDRSPGQRSLLPGDARSADQLLRFDACGSSRRATPGGVQQRATVLAASTCGALALPTSPLAASPCSTSVPARASSRSTAPPSSSRSSTANRSGASCSSAPPPWIGSSCVTVRGGARPRGRSLRDVPRTSASGAAAPGGVMDSTGCGVLAQDSRSRYVGRLRSQRLGAFRSALAVHLAAPSGRD